MHILPCRSRLGHVTFAPRSQLGIFVMVTSTNTNVSTFATETRNIRALVAIKRACVFQQCIRTWAVKSTMLYLLVYCFFFNIFRLFALSKKKLIFYDVICLLNGVPSSCNVQCIHLPL